MYKNQYKDQWSKTTQKQTPLTNHTHTHMYIYINIYNTLGYDKESFPVSGNKMIFSVSDLKTCYLEKRSIYFLSLYYTQSN